MTSCSRQRYQHLRRLACKFTNQHILCCAHKRTLSFCSKYSASRLQAKFTSEMLCQRLATTRCVLCLLTSDFGEAPCVCNNWWCTPSMSNNWHDGNASLVHHKCRIQLFWRNSATVFPMWHTFAACLADHGDAPQVSLEFSREPFWYSCTCYGVTLLVCHTQLCKILCHVTAMYLAQIDSTCVCWGAEVVNSSHQLVPIDSTHTVLCNHFFLIWCIVLQIQRLLIGLYNFFLMCCTCVSCTIPEGLMLLWEVLCYQMLMCDPVIFSFM